MARILIIDDDVHMRSMLRLMLESSDYEVVEAADGDEGLKLHKKKPADLIVTDIFMPEKDGLELIKEIGRQFLETKVIALSGGGSLVPENYLHLAKDLGAECTFKKPFASDGFLKAVNELLV